MLIEPLLQLLNKLKLPGMLAAFERQLNDPDAEALRFEERLAMLLHHELAERENTRFSQRLRIAALPQPACLEDLDTHIPSRHLDPVMLSTVRDLGWIARHLNVLITGPTGIGKSFIGAALAHAACRMNYHVRCYRLPRLIDELARAHAFQRRATFLRNLAKADLLLIDLCCAASNVEWNVAVVGTTRFAGNMGHISQSRRSQLVISAPSTRSFPALGGAIASGNTCESAARFISRSARAYRIVTLSAECPSH